MTGRRTNRVAALLRETIATLLIREAKDPGLAGIIVTDVDVSVDLRHARVYYRVLGPEVRELQSERAHQALSRAAGYIQAAVGRALRLRYTPELDFVFDPTPDRARRVDKLLEADVGDAAHDGAAPMEDEDVDGRSTPRR
jgi:ribosome-binding factor A